MLIRNNFQPSFKGFQDDIRVCEEAVRDIRRLHLHSNTEIELRKQNLMRSSKKDDSKTEQLYTYLSRLQNEYNYDVGEVQHQYNSKNFNLKLPQDYFKFVENIKEAVLMYKAGNCGEQNILLQSALLKKGEKADIIQFDIKYKSSDRLRNCGAHQFLVVGLDRNADIQNPETWGNEAIIADAWSGIAKRASLGVVYLKQLFNFNPEKEKIVFKKIPELNEQL